MGTINTSMHAVQQAQDDLSELDSLPPLGQDMVNTIHAFHLDLCLAQSAALHCVCVQLGKSLSSQVKWKHMGLFCFVFPNIWSPYSEVVPPGRESWAATG